MLAKVLANAMSELLHSHIVHSVEPTTHFSSEYAWLRESNPLFKSLGELFEVVLHQELLDFLPSFLVEVYGSPIHSGTQNLLKFLRVRSHQSLQSLIHNRPIVFAFVGHGRARQQ